MICNNCRKEITDGSMICPNCGADQNAVEKTVGIWDGGSMISPSASLIGKAAQNAAAVSESKKIDFFGAVNLFFQNYINFSGRTGKREFWLAFLFNFIVNAIICAVAVLLYFVAILCLAFLIPGISMGVRRLHDVGKSGCFMFLALIPIVGWIILMIQFIKDSDGDNQYGSAPGKTDDVKAEESPEEIIYRLSQEHEPRNINTPEAKKMLDDALFRIIPTYAAGVNLVSAIMQCNPHDIKANIDAMDKDTLLVISKALRQHISMGEDVNTINMVQNGVISLLKEKI